ncbi:MAG: (2Fe-2S)-binding protein [Bacteroidetes bacterium]|nr:(2Fe-2S)-binding protein [Bacteroidota bacterium]MBV6461304.1 putative xanthine dehydrogenase YagT iron-sulfur-binding subunit [Flavobacteriales bacterium]WKZ75296.1 MAG: (2Fe-2S)-binding protein [Vicingaceae bacterium]MCL4816563.1 (2Fe-2S)-binding protein [Flavobacteriales bacterium]NOG94341.1 (2Fe-2S)-binding protein [Bacteroidota bacterium]
MEITFTLNGKKTTCQIKASTTLLELLREALNLTGTKPGCHEGECGACTVLINGKSVNSCLYLALNANGKEITTIEGLTKPNGGLDEVQESMIKNGAVQCGFCTSGMVLNIKALQLETMQNKKVPGSGIKNSPNRNEIKKWLEGNLCRCTGYVKIIDAAEEVFNKGK